MYDIEKLKSRFQALLQQEIGSVMELKKWLVEERLLCAEVEEEITSRLIDFYKNTQDAEKRDLHVYYQTNVQPVLTQYIAEFDTKFCNCPFTRLLADETYGYMRKARIGKSELFHKDNSTLTVKEQELITTYKEIMSPITIEWEGDLKSYSYIKAKLDSPDREIRERAWRTLADSHMRVKHDVDSIMNELVKLRHQMALNAGYTNYRDYMFKLKNREYSIQDCYTFHESIETYVVPVWKHIANLFEKELGIEKYRPWDLSPCTLQTSPFSDVHDLLDGVEKMLGEMDSDFQERFQHIRGEGLMDIEEQTHKAPGAICFTLPRTKDVFIHSNFSPSFNAINALVHEVGHAFHFYKQFENESSMQERFLREEIAELYSHSLELLVMDKLNIFYPDEKEYKRAQLEQMYRAFSMLISPVVGDMFQHWLYTNPTHSVEERDAKYLELSKRFHYSSVDITGVEVQIGASWIESFHYFQYPFYKIEYAISQLGALQLFRMYREDPEEAVRLFKEGASADWNLSIEDIYRRTGVVFDFSEQTVKRISDFTVHVMEESTPH
jgi:M3 family oligoendopeptidase